jgi:hypothetical protein
LGWVKAARWHGYKAFEFFELDGTQQSFLVAAYETAMQCEAVEAHEASKPK